MFPRFSRFISVQIPERFVAEHALNSNDAYVLSFNQAKFSATGFLYLQQSQSLHSCWHYITNNWTVFPTFALDLIQGYQINGAEN